MNESPLPDVYLDTRESNVWSENENGSGDSHVMMWQPLIRHDEWLWNYSRLEVSHDCGHSHNSRIMERFFKTDQNCYLFSYLSCMWAEFFKRYTAFWLLPFHNIIEHLDYNSRPWLSLIKICLKQSQLSCVALSFTIIWQAAAAEGDSHCKDKVQFHETSSW